MDLIWCGAKNFGHLTPKNGFRGGVQNVLQKTTFHLTWNLVSFFTIFSFEKKPLIKTFADDSGIIMRPLGDSNNILEPMQTLHNRF